MTDISDLLFTQTHEWIKVNKDNTAVIGVTDFAQQLMSEVTQVDIPEPDDQVYEAGEELGVIESLRNSLAFHCPVSGTIIDSNRKLLATPETVNEDPFGAGWIFKLKLANPDELEELLTPDEYESHLPEDDDV
jgi:glycine cleavage system H protein